MAFTTPPSRLAVVGLGYVGLPLACRFALYHPTIGFDINGDRIRELQRGHDRNGELSEADLGHPSLTFSNDEDKLTEADFFVVTVPTPVNGDLHPDLSALKQATITIGRALKRRYTKEGGRLEPATVVYESTVYPGCTEGECVPILERESGLRKGRDFKVGYSPERINPGDPSHGLDRIVKVVSGEDDETLELIATVYGPVASNQIHRAPNIRTAEAAKIIENVQRDVNIALVNELAMLFHRLDLDTNEIFEAARTKWNFLDFRPGLVGGHCIPVDPYYLAHRAQQAGYTPEVILAGRKVNNSIGDYVGQEAARLVAKARGKAKGAKVIVLGAAFKENVRDSRNTGVKSLVEALERHALNVVVYDPMLSPSQIEREGLRVVEDPFCNSTTYDAVVLAVPHKELVEQPVASYLDLLRNGSQPGVFVDLKSAMKPFREQMAEANVVYWSL